MIDTLKVSRRLAAEGFTAQQAETLREAIESETVTKRDLGEMEQRIDGRFTALNERFAVIDERIDGVEARITLRLIKWLLGTAATSVILVIGAIGGLLLRLVH
jgi:hypothetical protein